MASVRHIRGTTWNVRIPNGRDPATGKRRTIARSFEANGQRDAERKARAIVAAHERRQDELAEHRGSMAELVDDWLRVKARTNSPSTMRAYERHAERIKDRLGRVRAAELQGADIDRWYGELADTGTPPAGIVVLHRHLRAVLRFGYTRRGLPSVATDRADPGEYRAPEIHPPKPAAVLAMLGALPIESAAWARAVGMLAHTGQRRGEVVGLRWADIDLEDGWLTVRHSVIEPDGGGVIVRPFPKGKRSRRVPLERSAIEVLAIQRAWLDSTATPGSPWVFPDLAADTSGRTPRRPSYISQAWQRERVGLGAAGWRLHDLRHAWATMMLDRGVPLNTVQAWLGHAKASTTSDIYGHRGDAGELLGREVIREALSPADLPAPQIPPGIAS